MTIESEGAKSVLAALSAHLKDVSANDGNFERLPGSYWGYYARGHDSAGVFGAIVLYSDEESDVDDIIKVYEAWVAKKQPKSGSVEPRA